MFSQPEEKLWLVVKHYNGVLDSNPGSNIDGKKGIKLEKNSVIKMGRVRLRVRDIDYADEVKPVKPNLTPAGKAPTGSPSKKVNSATKLQKTLGNVKKTGESCEKEEFDGIVDLNEIKLLEEA